MPINVFGSSSSSYENGKKIDTSLFVQKPFMRTNSIESNIEEDYDLKNQYTIKNLPHLLSMRQAASKSYVDNKFNERSIIKRNNSHPDIDLNYTIIINVGLIEINRLPEYGGQLKSKCDVDNLVKISVDESTSLRLDIDEKLNLDEQDSILLNSTLISSKTDIDLSKMKIELPTKNYVDEKVDDLSMIKNTTHVDFNDKNLGLVRFTKVNSMPPVGEHLTAKYYVDHAISYSVDELSLLTLDPNEKFKLDEQDFIILDTTLTSPKTII